MILDLSKYRVVDLSPQVVAEVETYDGEKTEGSPDPLGERCRMTQHVGGEGTDHTMSGSVRMSGHVGSHTESGKGHITHWEGFEKQTGLWEYPLDAFYGEAVVCDVSSVKPLSEEESKGRKSPTELAGFPFPQGFRGQPITPEHLGNVRKGDIVLMWSQYTRIEEWPYIPAKTADWLIDTNIKMLGIQLGFRVRGLFFDTTESTTHKKLLTNNIPITYPLVNLDNLKRERVFYMGLPIKIAQMDATWVRAIAVEEL